MMTLATAPTPKFFLAVWVTAPVLSFRVALAPKILRSITWWEAQAALPGKERTRMRSDELMLGQSRDEDEDDPCAAVMTESCPAGRV